MKVGDISQCLVVEEKLQSDTLIHLFAGNILAIKIPNFCEKARCEHLSKALSCYVKEETTSSGKIYLSNFDSFWNTIDNNHLRLQYFSRAVAALRQIRLISHPFLSPADLLRLELDEVWPYGSSLMHIEKQAMFFGIIRIWVEGTEALPHQDLLHREISDLVTTDEYSQLGANIYLQPAEDGGALEIWDHVFSDKDCEKHNLKGSYGFSRDLLPKDSLVIHPEQGDLILLNTTKVHAIRKILRGERITISGFIGYWGKQKPLKYWS